MKYVIDSSVAFKFGIPETDSAKAIQLRDDFRNAVHELLAPDVYSIELAHALTRAERQGRIPVGRAAFLWDDILAEPPQIFSSAHLIPRAIAISSGMRIGVYDCLYVALAEQEKCDFVTADDKLLKNLKAKFSFLVDLTSLP